VIIPFVGAGERWHDPLLIGTTHHCTKYFLTAIVSVTEITDCVFRNLDAMAGRSLAQQIRPLPIPPPI
jgi:hypothetical protein